MAIKTTIKESQFDSKIKEDFEKNASNLKQLGQTIPDLKNAIKTLSAQGIKPPKSLGTTNGLKDNATDTSDLAGPKGGLGEAKIININFHDALQKVTVADGKGVVSAGKDAIEFIIRTLQNFAYSQSTTQ